MPSRDAVRAIRTAISPRLAIRTDENMDMRYHPGDEEYTSPGVFHGGLVEKWPSADGSKRNPGQDSPQSAALPGFLLRSIQRATKTGYAHPYCGSPAPDGRVTAPSVGASPTATGAAGCALGGREPTAAAGVRACGGRRGGTGAVAGRGLPSLAGAPPTLPSPECGGG